ncbi:fimbrial biogenesis chaperone, partial [Pseudomonas sp. GM80]|uniref:fimbrial biogenesis chaperone n=1 Tax=Pseudomonas sp. GM80 TaxID=1144339 RepID=UPI00026FD0C4
MGAVTFIGRAFFALLVLGAGYAHAASSVLIWPIDPVLEADQQASALWLENRGNETANLQIRVFGWSQSGFEEQYQNQRDVIGRPPVAKIEP